MVTSILPPDLGISPTHEVTKSNLTSLDRQMGLLLLANYRGLLAKYPVIFPERSLRLHVWTRRPKRRRSCLLRSLAAGLRARVDFNQPIRSNFLLSMRWAVHLPRKPLISASVSAQPNGDIWLSIDTIYTMVLKRAPYAPVWRFREAVTTPGQHYSSWETQQHAIETSIFTR